MTSFSWFVLILILLATAKYTLGPVLVRHKSTAAVNPTFNEVSEEDARAWFPANFFGTIAELEAMGFSLVCHLTSGALVKRVHSMMSLLVNRSSQSVAMIAFVRSLSPQSPLVINYIEFHADFEDGSQLDTINSPTVSIFYPVPKKLQIRVPHLNDPSALYLVHLYLMKQQHSAAILPAAGMEKDAFIKSVRQSLAAQVETGLYFLDEKEQRYRLTWPGAYRSVYRQLWPMKQIHQRRQEREGRRIAKEAVVAAYKSSLQNQNMETQKGGTDTPVSAA